MIPRSTAIVIKIGALKKLGLGLIFAVGIIMSGIPALRAGPASDFVQSLGRRAISVLQQKDMRPGEREEKFRGILKDGFDMPLVARFALGRYWRIAGQEQRRDYLNLFARYVAQSYSAKLAGYKNESFVIVSEKLFKNRKDVLVTTRIERPGKNPITTTWRVRKSENSVRIIDVMVEGISMLVTYRDEFSAVIRRRGLEGFLKALRTLTGISTPRNG